MADKPLTVHEKLITGHIRHQVGIGRYANSVVKDVITLLNASDKELVKKIHEYGGPGGFTKKRLDALLEETDRITKEAAASLTDATGKELGKFAQHEAEWGSKLMGSTMGAVFDVVTPSAEKLTALVTEEPFQGALLGEWFGKLASDKQHLLTQTLRLGQAQSETTEQLIRRVVGTKANAYQDGALEISRQHAASVVRTAVNHTSNAAQQLTLATNQELVHGWIFLATLDAKTTITCASLSGTKWPVGEGPIPPRHFNCRSFALPWLKTFKELGFNIDELPPSTRASMGGQVSADISFSDWLKGQPIEVQDEILGKTRGELFRKGGLTVDQFADGKGNVLTLDELKAKEAAAFKKTFPGGGGSGSGGGHLSKTIPIAAPKDFSAIVKAQVSPEVLDKITKEAEAKAKKKAYMAQYNAAKQAEKAAAKLAEAQKAAEEAIAAEKAKAEALAEFKQAVVSGSMSMSEEAETILATLPKAEKDKVYQEALALKQEAEVKAKALMNAKAEWEKAALGGGNVSEAAAAVLKEWWAQDAEEYAKFASKVKKTVAEAQAAKEEAKVTYHEALKALMKDPNDALALGDMSVASAHLTVDEIATIAKAVQVEVDAAKALEAAAASDDQAKKWLMYKSKIKKALLEGKTLPPSFQATLDAVPAAEQAKFLAQIEVQLAKAEIAPAAAEVVEAKVAAATENRLLYSDMEKLQGKMGSNDGGLYLNRATGEKWYIKTPASGDMAVNEVVSNHLYRLAGIDVPELRYITVEGRLSIASKWTEGLVSDSATLSNAAKARKVAGVFEGFAMDAWLANWDVVGLSFDNLLLNGGRAVRIDTGGSLLYRAQGGLKGLDFGKVVNELDSLRNTATNPQSAKVFGKITTPELEAGVRRVLKISEEDIRAVINKYGAEWSAEEREKLVETLIARQEDLAKRFPNLMKDITPAPLKDAGAKITAQELERIKQSRINGYVVPTDKTSIEDHHVLFWVEKDAAGNPITKARLKLTGNAYDKLNKEVSSLVKEGAAAPKSAVAGFSVEQNADLAAKITEAIKGIATQASKGEALRDKDWQRVQEIKSLWAKARNSLAAEGGGADPALAYYRPWVEKLNKAIDGGVGTAAKWESKTLFAAYDLPLVVEKAAGGTPWTKENFKFVQKQLVNGEAKQTGSALSLKDTVTTTLGRNIDGVKINYWGQDAVFALQGNMELAVTGEGKEAVEKLLSALEKAGVDAARSTALDREELYLRQVAYHLNSSSQAGFEKALGNIASQDQRVVKLKEYLSREIGKDVTKLKGYDPEGSYQAFGQGRVNTFRPDLEGPLWESFQKEYRLFHNITNGDMVSSIDQILSGGGQMAPTVDKLRRGIPMGGMSPDADLGTGGANYFFTRIKHATSDCSGVYWKSDLVSRLDAISYQGDMYGRTSGNTVRSHRISDIAGWKNTAGYGSNETIFKNSLSLFDKLDKIKTGNESTCDAIIQVFKKHGYTKFPDGRALLDVIKI